MLPLIIVKKGPRSRRRICLSHCSSTPIYIHDQSPVTIDDVRQLTRQISLTSLSANQFLVIVHAHTLTLPSQHALLKTLEESPTNTCIILGVSRLHALIPTIISRCQVINPPYSKTPSTKQTIDIPKIFTASYGELSLLAQNHDKKQAQVLMKQILSFIRQGLLQHPTLKRATAIKLTQEGINDLNTNINPSLILENTLFRLKQISTASTNVNPRG